MGIYNLFKRAWIACEGLAARINRVTFWLFLDYCWAYIKHGCVPSHYVRGNFYKKSEIVRSNILTYRRAMQSQKHFNHEAFVHYLDSKIDFNKYFSKFIRRDWLDVQDISLDEFKCFLQKHKSFIVKPKNLLQGKGIYVCSASDDDNIESIYEKLKCDNVLIEELIVQHDRMVFNNASVNTIRVMSLLDRKGECHILKTILRAGVGTSIVDNYCAGGCIYAINEELGYVESKGVNKTGEEFIVHPNSDVVMLGYTIPHWNELISLIKEAHKSIPQCRFIGWDVAITNFGTELIEGNHNPDYELYEFVGKSELWVDIKRYW